MVDRSDIPRFDRWASSYEKHWMLGAIFDPVHSVALDLAASEVVQPRSILDIGCGTGRLLRAAAARFDEARLDGVDASADGRGR